MGLNTNKKIPLGGGSTLVLLAKLIVRSNRAMVLMEDGPSHPCALSWRGRDPTLPQEWYNAAGLFHDLWNIFCGDNNDMKVEPNLFNTESCISLNFDRRYYNLGP